MTDRELLELAAKAAGYWLSDDGMCALGVDTPFVHWNPLQDDGDALRLLVTLREDLCLESAAMLGCGNFSVWNADPYAATRRAIVRAAAAIGESMP